MRHRGFTLIELVIAITVLGILATIALPRFVRVVEKSRSAEARNALGVIRDAERAYYMEFNAYTINLNDLNLPLPAACNTSFYYRYWMNHIAGDVFMHATRCTAGGRSPQSPIAYDYVIMMQGDILCTDLSLL